MTQADKNIPAGKSPLLTLGLCGGRRQPSLPVARVHPPITGPAITSARISVTPPARPTGQPRNPALPISPARWISSAGPAAFSADSKPVTCKRCRRRQVVGVEVDASFPNYLNSRTDDCVARARPSDLHGGGAGLWDGARTYWTRVRPLAAATQQAALPGPITNSPAPRTRELRSAALPFPVLRNRPSRCAPVGRSGRASRRRSCRRGLRDWSTFIPTSATRG